MGERKNKHDTPLIYLSGVCLCLMGCVLRPPPCHPTPLRFGGHGPPAAGKKSTNYLEEPGEGVNSKWFGSTERSLPPS